MNTLPKTSDLLSNDYILPLLGASRAGYGPAGNFVSCQLTDENQIVVTVLDRTLVAYQLLADHPAYFLDYLDPDTGCTILVYHAKVWLPDIQKFRQGKYSQFSAEAKKRIKTFMGNFDVYGKFRTYSELEKQGEVKLRLHALDKTERARAYWENLLEVKLDPEAELENLPTPSCFVNLNE